jgi:plastocyanin
MRRALCALAVLLLAVALGTALPAGAAPSAGAAAKHRCKHRAKHHRKKRCRRKKKSATNPAADKPKGDDPSVPSGPPGRLLATERELSSTQLQLQLSRASLAAGSTIVEQYNAGSDPHNLILERQGTVAFSFPTLDPGGDQKQTLTLTAGTWTLYCSLLNHKDLGMQATLTVN